MRNGNGDLGERVVAFAGEIDGGEVERLRAGGRRRAEMVDVDLKMRGVRGDEQEEGECSGNERWAYQTA